MLTLSFVTYSTKTSTLNILQNITLDCHTDDIVLTGPNGQQMKRTLDGLAGHMHVKQ